jgi:DNA-directed RNA polymerase subunit beta'
MDTTNVGKLLVDDALPEDLRKPEYAFDKAGMHELMRQVAEKYPDQYRDILHKLSEVGRDSVYTTGASVSLSGLRSSPAKEAIMGPARQQLAQIVNNDKLSDKDREKAIVDTLLPLNQRLQDDLFAEAKHENNPYYLQLISGARGKKSDYNSLRGADLLTADQSGRVIPIPILHSYAEGLDPVEYWAGMYGQRKGGIDVKDSTAQSGYLGKKLVNATHRIVVTKEKPDETRVLTGLPVSPKDKDSVGAILAKSAGEYPAGTLLTDKILKDIDKNGEDEIVVHSPMAEQTEDGGISRLAAGKRDRFGLSEIGDNIGIPASQSISEKLSQSALGSKHISGVANIKKENAGLDVIQRLVEAPEHFPEAGPLAEEDGVVNAIDDAPQGGRFITVGKTRHYAHSDLDPVVKVGDRVEAGDSLTDGLPHPVDLVRHKGIGEARRLYLKYFGDVLRASGAPTHRRNLEAVVSGLINHAVVTDPDGIGDHVPDDVVSYNQLAHGYKPRPDAKLSSPSSAVGNYLEEPALHYTIGTKVTRKVADHLKRHGIQDVHSHPEPPGFSPHLQRGILGVHSDPDWQTALSGFYTASSFQRNLARGAVSDPNSTSYVPAAAAGTDFGKHLKETGTYGPDLPGS